MEDDWYGESLTPPAHTTILGYCIAASHPEHPTYLMHPPGNTLLNYNSASQWLETEREHTPNGWTYQLVRIQTVP